MTHPWQDHRLAHSAGQLDPQFANVAQAFVQNFEDGMELGASFAVYHHGREIINLWGGFADRKKETPWTENTIACIFSSGKAVMTYLIAREVAGGTLDYDTPVAHYWPEFAANGKETITLAQALSHQAGLCGFPDEIAPQDWLNWGAITNYLADMTPLWTPGSASGYHPQTIGFIAGEVLRRVTGKTVKQLLADRCAAKGYQLYCGLDRDQIDRIAYMPKPPKAPDLGALNAFTQLAFLKPWSAPAKIARDEWAAAQIPASNMHGNAHALAALLSPLAGQNGAGNTLPPDVLSACFKERSRGDDVVLPFNLSWSAGMMRNINRHFGPNESAFGHAGFGGSSVVIDPHSGLSMAYVMNKMSPHLVGDPRALRLIEAVYDAL